MRIYEVIEAMEALRKKYIMMERGVALVMIVAFGGVFLGMMTPLVPYVMVLPFLAVPVAIIVAMRLSQVQKEFKMFYKEYFAKAALDELLEKYDYRWEHGFTEREVGRFGLVRLGNRFHSEDYLRSSYKGIEFEQSDVTIKRVVKRKNGSSTTIYFRGRMVKFNVSIKKIVAMQVFTDNFHYRANPRLPMERVEMESVEFNNMFDVTSVRPHDAFYLLTPHFMEKIKEFAAKYSSVGMMVTSNALYVALGHARDSFDANMKNEINFPVEMARMKEDIQDIFDVIDVLELE